MSIIETENLCGLKRKDFQTTINGKKTDLYILRNRLGYEVAITNYGGAIVAIMVPDKDGKVANVIQGHDNIQDVPTGFHARVWDARQMGPRSLVLHRVSSYGEEGFTGEVDITVEFTWSDDNELIIEYLASTNKKTIVNLTHHGFFSLAGTANPTPAIDDLMCEINADFYLPIDETSIPTGEIRKVAGTPFDFRTPKPVGQDIDADDEQIKNGAGYDHCFVLNKREEGELSFAARIEEPHSGRTMEVYTTEPGVQVYSDNWADGYKGGGGATFGRRSAICFECQHFPDTPNRPYFPSVVLRPHHRYKQKTVYRFGVK